MSIEIKKNTMTNILKDIEIYPERVKIAGFSGIHFWDGTHSLFEYYLLRYIAKGIISSKHAKNIVKSAFARPHVYEGKERAIERLRESNLPSWAVDIVEDDVHGVENVLNTSTGRTIDVINHFKYHLKEMSRILGYDVRLLMTAHHSPSWAILFGEYYCSTKSALHLRREDLVVKISNSNIDIIDYSCGDVREEIRLLKQYVGPDDKAWNWKLQMVFQGEVRNTIEELASSNQTWNDMHFNNNSCIGGAGPNKYLVENRRQFCWVAKNPTIGTGFHDWGHL